MNKIVDLLENISEYTGRIFAWSTTAMVWLLFALVIIRYGFGSFSQKMSELGTYLFAISFLMASGYALKHDNHVRVDLLYAKWSNKGKSLSNLIGTCLFLLPWTIICIYVCTKYAMVSFAMNEASDQPSGLPAVYVLKFILMAGFFFLFIQALALALKSIITLVEKPIVEDVHEVGDHTTGDEDYDENMI